jgi:hypothetical protein
MEAQITLRRPETSAQLLVNAVTGEVGPSTKMSGYGSPKIRRSRRPTFRLAPSASCQECRMILRSRFLVGAGGALLAAREPLGWPTLSILVSERVGLSSPLTSSDCFFSSSARVHAQQTFSSIVVAPTAPRPISGMLHELCSDGISVHIVELLRHLRAGVDIEIIIAALPETPIADNSKK